MTPPNRMTTALAGAAIIGYQLLLLTALLLRPDLDPARSPVSEYAIGRHGWVTVLAFLVAAASYGCLFAAARRAVGGRAGRVGLALLAACAAGTAGVGVFVADPVVTPLDALSPVGALHVACGLAALLLLPFAALLINLDAARADPDGARTLRRTAGLPLAGLLLHWLLSLVVPPEGWPPRLLFLTYAVWLLVLTTRLRVSRLPAAPQ